MLNRVENSTLKGLLDMDNETYILGLYDSEKWSFFNGEEWVSEVQEAHQLDKSSAFDLCEKFAQQNLHVVVFRSKIFEGCDSTFDFS
jgi:hypothetical protein